MKACKQSYLCTHFMVADGVDVAEVRAWDVEHIQLNQPHEDAGNIPRGIGSLAAMNQGSDAIASFWMWILVSAEAY